MKYIFSKLDIEYDARKADSRLQLIKVCSNQKSDLLNLEKS